MVHVGEISPVSHQHQARRVKILLHLHRINTIESTFSEISELRAQAFLYHLANILQHQSGSCPIRCLDANSRHHARNRNECREEKWKAVIRRSDNQRGDLVMADMSSI